MLLRFVMHYAMIAFCQLAKQQAHRPDKLANQQTWAMLLHADRHIWPKNVHAFFMCNRQVVVFEQMAGRQIWCQAGSGWKGADPNKTCNWKVTVLEMGTGKRIWSSWLVNITRFCPDTIKPHQLPNTIMQWVHVTRSVWAAMSEKIRDQGAIAWAKPSHK